MTEAQADAAELDRILAGRLVASRYQSIVDLRTQRTVGFEAFARGPEGSPLEFPERLFAAAQRADRIDELDALCRARAIEGFAPPQTGGPTPTLFVNARPRGRSRVIASEFRSSMQARSPMPVVFEFSERALVDQRAAVLSAGRELRRVDAGVGVDDAGLDPQAFTLLEALKPRVVKLHMQIVQQAGSAHSARVARAVGTISDRTDAWIVAKGIETSRHLSAARAVGASYGQGWLFSDPDG